MCIRDRLGADDLTTERLKGIFHEWYDIVKVNDLDVVNLIRDKKINILFDLTGYSTGNWCEDFMFACSLYPADVKFLKITQHHYKFLGVGIVTLLD